jgi:hypothetical protein
MTLVLVVDDDQDLAEMLGIVLTGAEATKLWRHLEIILQT